ncbi:hypothetical protein BH10CYA1_BH10CYA1_48320 [soil metagenome]
MVRETQLRDTQDKFVGNSGTAITFDPSSYWNSKDMGTLSKMQNRGHSSEILPSLSLEEPQSTSQKVAYAGGDNRSESRLPSSDQQAFVNARFTRTGKLIFEEEGTGKAVVVDAFSGRGIFGYGYQGGQGADGRYDNVKNYGPIPKGDYYIEKGTQNRGVKDSHPGGDATWYKLVRIEKDGSYGRDEFYIHTGLASWGCVGVKSDVPNTASSYPYSTAFQKVKRLLNNTKKHPMQPSNVVGILTVE